MTDELVANASVAEVTESAIATMIARGLITPTKQTTRKKVNWERLLAYEYVEKFYQGIPHWFRLEVGPMPNGSTDLIYSKTRRWADCVIHLPDHTLVIEFKMKAEPAVVSQLIHYGQLVPQTPMLVKYKDLPVKIKVVAAMVDDVTHAFIESQGIDVEIYKPTNFEQWYKQVILREK